MSANPDAMHETLTRFPIRCTAITVLRVSCDAPAVLAVTAAPECGCPPKDHTVCAKHAGQFVVGYRRGGRRHIECGQIVSYVVTGRRPLNEGDLP